MDFTSSVISEFPFDDIESMLKGTGWETFPSHSSEYELGVTNGITTIEVEFGDTVVLSASNELAAYPKYMFDRLSNAI